MAADTMLAIGAEITMPRLSDSMEEGTIISWLVASGDQVEAGQDIAEIETDKATMTYEVDATGVIELRAEEGDTVAVGAVIAVVGGEDAPARPPAAPPPGPDPRRESASAAPRREDPSPVRPRGNASPVARRAAALLGVDLAGLNGTGPRGRVVKADVERAAQAPAAPSSAEPAAGVRPSGGKGEVDVRELSRVQEVIARRMAEAKATVPEFVLSCETDMGRVVALREEMKSGGASPVPSVNDFVIKASALALREHPLANGAYRDGRFELFGRINIGMAVATADALVVPTILDADEKSLGQITRVARTLAAKVRDGTITPPELSGGTFSISNLGMYGINAFTAVINPPQAAILAVGAVSRRPVVDGELLAIGHTMTLSLTCDHRILYGAQAAEFLGRIRQLLEAPAALVL